MKAIAISLFALILLSGSACTEVFVVVHQPTSTGTLTGTHCKLKRELQNKKQETDFWCWAASAHTVIAYLKQDDTIQQCNLLNYAVGLDPNNVAADSLNCCKTTTPMSPSEPKSTTDSRIQCWRNGSPDMVFDRLPFTVTYEPIYFYPSYDGPQGLEWDEIATEICADRPFISAIAYSGPAGGAHMVVIGGYKELADGTQWVQVYDPGYSTLEEDYYLWSYDVYLGDPGVFTHVADYKKISIP
jgi:hypothetical protein